MEPNYKGDRSNMKKQNYQTLKSMSCVVYACLGGLLGLTTLAAISLLSSAVSATDNSSLSFSATITVASSCSFTSDGIIRYASMVNGTSTVITGDSITTSCNDIAGYAVYAIGYSSDSYSASDRTDMISSTNSSYNIKTDGSNFGSSWKMQINDPVDATVASGFTTYHDIPSSLTKVASYTSATTAGSITPAYQITVGNTQPAGTYTGKVKYILLHPNTIVAGNISVAYNANGGTGSTVTVNNIPNYETYTLVDNGTTNFTGPEGYFFGGWCTTDTAGPYACSGERYAPGEEVTSLASNGQTANLYAIWSKYIQDLTPRECSIFAASGDLTVYDKRSAVYPAGDDGSYTVRYINNQCWMTQNLRVRGSIPASESNFTGNDFNVSQYDLETDGAAECGSESGGFSHACSHVPTQADITSVGSGATADSIGVWYNYCAATASTICSVSDDRAAVYDICPAGWHLPTGPNSTVYTDLNKLVGNTTSGWQNPTAGLTSFNAVRGGDYKDGKLEGVKDARWWASTTDNLYSRNTLFYDSNNGSFAGSYKYNRTLGFFIRCVRS